MTDRDLFIAALDHADPADRAAWLEHACAGDPDRRRRVEVLLRAHDDASRFLAAPAPAPGDSVAPEDPTRTAHSSDETTPAATVDVLSFLQPADKPGLLGRLDHFEVIEIVGKGGIGVVLKAFDPKLHRLVALKLMAPHLAAHGGARKRFEREAKAVAAVRNEHVVAIHGVQTDGPVPYLIMEFVGGVSLQDRLDRRGPADVKEVLRIGMQAAHGLAAAHAQGIVHRDIKPANILLENGVERVKITDFGLARAADDANLTQSGVITGTPNYMSPEQAAGTAVDARSDLFSLGSVLYALCTGHPPFRAETPLAVLRRVCDDPVRPPREANPDVPDWLDAIVRKLLAKNPADRFQTATEVADLLGQHLAHLQQPSAAAMPAPVLPSIAVPPQPRSPVGGSGQRPASGCLLAPLALVALVLFRDTLYQFYRSVYFAPFDMGLSVWFGWALIRAGRRKATSAGNRRLWDLAWVVLIGGTAISLVVWWHDLVDHREHPQWKDWHFSALLLSLLIGETALVPWLLARQRAKLAAATASSPPPPAPPTSPAGFAWLVLIGLVAFPALLFWTHESFWEGYFRPGYTAPLYMLVSSGLLLAVLWWCRRQSEPAWYRRALAVAMAAVVGGTLMGLLSSWGEGSYLDKLGGASNWDSGGMMVAAAIVIGSAGIRVCRWVAWGPAPRPARAAVAVAAVIGIAGAGAVCWAVATGRLARELQPDPDPETGYLRVVKDDPDAEVIVERPGDRLVQGSPGGPSTHGVRVSADVAYTLSIRKGGVEVHNGVVRLKAGERREIRIPPIARPEPTIRLVPKAGSFPSDAVRMEISPDRSAVAVERFDGPILVFDVATGKERFRIDRPKTHNTAFGFTPDGKHLAYLAPAGPVEYVLQVVDVGYGHQVGKEIKPQAGRAFANSHALAYSPDGKRLAVSCAFNVAPDDHWESQVLRWETAPGGAGPRELDPLVGQPGTIEALRSTGDGSEVLAVNGTSISVGWRWDSGKESRRDVSTRTAKYLVAAGREHEAVAEWDQNRRKGYVNPWWPEVLREEPGHSLPPSAVAFSCLAFSPDDRLLAAGTRGLPNLPWDQVAAVHVWDRFTADERAILLGHADWPLAIAFEPDGQGLLTAGKDGTVRHWKLP